MVDDIARLGLNTRGKTLKELQEMAEVQNIKNKPK
jgi:hypothetical protein